MWETPKTDWKSGDFFNVSDYNRIKNNLDELKNLSRELWSTIDYDDYREMGEDKTYQDVSFYSDEINRLETNLEIICNRTYAIEIGDTQSFRDNTLFIGSEELNRVEGAILRIYDNLKNQYEGRRMFSFMLGSTREAL